MAFFDVWCQSHAKFGLISFVKAFEDQSHSIVLKFLDLKYPADNQSTAILGFDTNLKFRKEDYKFKIENANLK